MPLTQFQRGAYVRCLIKRGLIDKEKAKELTNDEVEKMSEPFRKKSNEKTVVKKQEVKKQEVKKEAEPPPSDKLSIDDIREMIREEVENVINEIDFTAMTPQQVAKTDGGGYSNMIYMLIFQAVLKVAPPLIETFLSSASKNVLPKSEVTSTGGTLNGFSLPSMLSQHTSLASHLPTGLLR